MSTKDEILALLARAPGQYFSGQEIADRLGITRASVWKSIKALKNSGYRINGIQNRGYALDTGTDVLDASGLYSLTGDLPLRIEVYDCVSSTNTLVRDRASSGEAEGLVIVSHSQTSGRGRNGRNFFSPPDTGLYLSVLLRPEISARRASLLTSLTAVAAAKAAESVCGHSIGIKWVNDLISDGKKVCGILTEAVMSLENEGLEYAVIGTGFNVSPPDCGWPEDIESTAGPLFPGRAPSGTRAKLAAEFLKNLFNLYSDFDNGRFQSEYRSRQAVIGQRVEVVSPAGWERPATALDVDDQCHLIVRYDDGSEETLFGGEIRIKPVNMPS